MKIKGSMYSRLLILTMTTGLEFALRVNGSSMNPTLYSGDTVIGNPFFRKIERGDIVCVEVLGTALLKRVIGTGGDHVHITAHGDIRVNGEWIDEDYILPQDKKGKVYDVIVPKNHIWVMGDNRGRSTDSREFGSVDASNVMYKIWRGKKWTANRK